VIRRLVSRPEAEDDITAAAGGNEARGRGLAGEFLRAFDAAVASIQRHLLQHSEVHAGIRR
jgi:hypothetical protein